MKKVIIAQKGIGVFLVFLMLWAVLVPTQFSNMAYAEELQSSVITGASITDLSNQPITNPIGAWRPFTIHANYVLPNHAVHTGDTTTMTLPVGFAAAQPFKFEVKAGNDLVANGQIIDGNPVKIVLTYTNYVETHSDVQGSFHFNTQINSNTQPSTGVIPVTLKVQGDNAVVDAGTVTFNPPQVTPVPLIKAGWMDSTDKTTGHYKINVNQANKAMVDAVLVDTLLNPGVEYVDGSFQVFEGVWVSNPTGTDIIFTDSTDITLEFANKISVQGNHFTVAIGSRPAGKGLQFRYKVKINYDPVVGEVFKNEVELDDNGQKHKYATSYKIMDAGGTGEGYVYKIQIEKKAEGSGDPLSGATFKVIRVSNNQTVGTITTGLDGKAEIGDLLKDKYKLVETEAPEGYQKLKDPIFVKPGDFEVKPGDFGADKIALKIIKNELEEKISVKVTKIWENSDGTPFTGDKPTIKLQLLKDGQPEGDLVELTNGNTTHEWKDLDKTDEDGNDHKYSVQEVGEKDYKIQLDGKWYGVTYGGTMKDGLTVTNKEKTTPPEKPDKPDKPNKPNGPTPPSGTTPPGGTTPSNGPTPPSATTPPDNPTQLENSTQTDKATKLNHSSKEKKTTLLKKIAQSGRHLPKTGDGANPAVYALALFALGSLLTVVGYRRRKNVN